MDRFGEVNGWVLGMSIRMSRWTWLFFGVEKFVVFEIEVELLNLEVMWIYRIYEKNNDNNNNDWFLGCYASLFITFSKSWLKIRWAIMMDHGKWIHFLWCVCVCVDLLKRSKTCKVLTAGGWSMTQKSPTNEDASEVIVI